MSKVWRLGLMSLVYLASFGAGSSWAAPEIGQPAPALVATQLDGKTFDLAVEKGKVVLVHFWATWCGACREEMPQLEAEYRHAHGLGLDVLAVSADRPRERDTVALVMHSFSYPAALLREMKTNDFGNPSVLPITYVIDRDGVVQAVLTPEEAPITETALDNYLKPFLNAKPKPQEAPKPDAKTDTKPDTNINVKVPDAPAKP